MITTFLIVLGILALLGLGGADDACCIVILIKVIPIILILVAVFGLSMCSH